MTRIPHCHVIDYTDCEWGAFADQQLCQQEIDRVVAQYDQHGVLPIAADDLTIIDAKDWCQHDGPLCYYERNVILDGTRTQTPEFTWHYPPEEPTRYRIEGKRVPRWKLSTSMSIDTAQQLWSSLGHPVALPQWRFDTIIMQLHLCPCANRSHRKKGCVIGPKGMKCHVCGTLYQDYGSGPSYCLPCNDWMTQREAYLANWAVHQTNNATATKQLALAI